MFFNCKCVCVYVYVLLRGKRLIFHFFFFQIKWQNFFRYVTSSSTSSLSLSIFAMWCSMWSFPGHYLIVATSRISHSHSSLSSFHSLSHKLYHFGGIYGNKRLKKITDKLSLRQQIIQTGRWRRKMT